MNIDKGDKEKKINKNYKHSGRKNDNKDIEEVENNIGDNKEENENHEMVYVNCNPYMIHFPQGGYTPVHTPKLGDIAIIDWSVSDEFWQRKCKRPNVDAVRCAKITKLICRNNFMCYTINKENYKRIFDLTLEDQKYEETEICWDGRGGWVERMICPVQKRILNYSCPIITFVDPQIRSVILAATRFPMAIVDFVVLFFIFPL